MTAPSFTELAELPLGSVLLVGWDSGVPVDPALLSASRSSWQDALEPDGVLVLLVEGRLQCWVIATDPSDGYRSTLEPITTVAVPPGTVLQFAHAPIVVAVEERTTYGPDDQSGGAYVALVDPAGHAWLVFGTDYYDDWYPCAVCGWSPR